MHNIIVLLCDLGITALILAAFVVLGHPVVGGLLGGVGLVGLWYQSAREFYNGRDRYYHWDKVLWCWPLLWHRRVQAWALT